MSRETRIKRFINHPFWKHGDLCQLHYANGHHKLATSLVSYTFSFLITVRVFRLINGYSSRRDNSVYPRTRRTKFSFISRDIYEDSANGIYPSENLSTFFDFAIRPRKGSIVPLCPKKLVNPTG